MFVIIVGGGRTGSHLASQLLAEGHSVRLIESRPEILSTLHRELPTETIFEGQGSSLADLEAAGIRQAIVLAAVTPDDAENLVVTSLAKHEFHVPRIIGRINNPRNAWLFTHDFGVDVALNQADVMARLIEQEMSLGDMMTMLKLLRGKYSLVEEKIAPGAPAIGRTIATLGLPPTCIVAGIVRHGELVLPRGNTQLEQGDEVLALLDDDSRAVLARLLGPAQLAEKPAK